MAKKIPLLFLLFLSYSYFGFSQNITGKLIYLKDEEPAKGVVYLNGILDKTASEAIQNDGTFIFRDLKNISIIEIVILGYGSLILTTNNLSSENEYDLGNLYFIENPNDQFIDFLYKTNIGYFFGRLTERIRSNRMIRKEVKENHKLLKDKYNSEGKSSKFLRKYDGHKQVLNLKFIE